MSLSLQTGFLITLDTAQCPDFNLDSRLLGLVALGNGLPLPFLQKMVFVDECLGRTS
jgi:hypothetical protein